MISLKDLDPQYIVNEKGEKKSVILSINGFEDLLADLEDLVVARKD